MYSKQFSRFVKVNVDSELFPSHIKLLLQALTANFFNSQQFAGNSYCKKIFIGTNLSDQEDFDYHIVIGNHDFQVQKMSESLVFFVNFAQASDILPGVFDLIVNKVKEDLWKRFESICDKTLKSLKISQHSENSLAFEELDRKISELILKNENLLKLKDQINELPEVQSLGIKIVESFDVPLLKNENLLPIYIEENLSLAWALNWQTSKDIDSSTLNIVGRIRQHLEAVAAVELKSNRFEVWEAAVEELPMAIVVMDSKNNIRIYNQKFIDLNLALKSLENLADREFIKVADESFQVFLSYITEGEDKYTIYLFQAITDQIDASGHNNEELGIICSSLAHELNNPIAGILASLTVIELEDEEGKLQGQMEEMKKGVYRCKQLVETFLGFSKSQKLENTKKTGESFKASLDQAMDLMRFRMIESNTSIQIGYNEAQKYGQELDFSLMVMMNYLLLGEILTSLSHYNLLMQASTKNVSLKILEENDLISIHWEPKFPLSSDFTQSRLFLHLLETQEFQIRFEEGKVSFLPFTSAFEGNGRPLA